MVNKVFLLGNVGKDPEVVTTNGGTLVAKFSLATTQGDNTQWHKVVAFKQTANFVQQYVHKGDKLFIEGNIQYKEHTDDNGVKRQYTQIVANTVRQLTPKQQEAASQNADYIDDLPL